MLKTSPFWLGTSKVFLTTFGLEVSLVVVSACSWHWSTTTWQSIFSLYAERFDVPLPKGGSAADACKFNGELPIGLASINMNPFFGDK